jgi:hypothetical protein
MTSNRRRKAQKLSLQLPATAPRNPVVRAAVQRTGGAGRHVLSAKNLRQQARNSIARDLRADSRA